MPILTLHWGADPNAPAAAVAPIALYYRMQKENPMQYLKQATASQSVLIGPFVDSTDGVTAETGLTIANTDIRLSVNGGNMVAKNSGGGTHDELGMYSITLDATDTATVGKLQLVCAKSGALPVYHTFYVVEENVYDAWFGAAAAAGTDLASILTDTGTTLQAELDGIQADTEDLQTRLPAALVGGRIDATVDATGMEAGAVTAIQSGLATAANLATVDTVVDAIKVVTDAQANIVGSGTCDTGGSTTAIIASAITPTSIEDDQFNGRIIIFDNDTTTTALRGQASDITDYAHATLTLTVTAMSQAPVSGDTFRIV